jgi:hypothetical protein
MLLPESQVSNFSRPGTQERPRFENLPKGLIVPQGWKLNPTFYLYPHSQDAVGHHHVLLIGTKVVIQNSAETVRATELNGEFHFIDLGATQSGSPEAQRVSTDAHGGARSRRRSSQEPSPSQAPTQQRNSVVFVPSATGEAPERAGSATGRRDMPQPRPTFPVPNDPVGTTFREEVGGTDDDRRHYALFEAGRIELPGLTTSVNEAPAPGATMSRRRQRLQSLIQPLRTRGVGFPGIPELMSRMRDRSLFARSVTRQAPAVLDESASHGHAAPSSSHLASARTGGDIGPEAVNLDSPTGRTTSRRRSEGRRADNVSSSRAQSDSPVVSSSPRTPLEEVSTIIPEFHRLGPHEQRQIVGYVLEKKLSDPDRRRDFMHDLGRVKRCVDRISGGADELDSLRRRLRQLRDQDAAVDILGFNGRRTLELVDAEQSHGFRSFAEAVVKAYESSRGGTARS